MKIKLTEKDSSQFAADKLATYYSKGLLVPEKKPFFSKHSHSTGAFLAVDESEFILDSASQIASLGLGYNAAPLFGVSHQLEAWLNNSQSDSCLELRSAFERFLKRKLGWDKLETFLCNSGAEANEIALGQCFQSRKSKKARKVLAFEGSFHGRLLISLFSTWNPKKREPFQVPGFETEFVEPAILAGGNFAEIKTPDNWALAWSEAASEKSLQQKLDSMLESADEQLKAEIDSLLNTRKQLASREIFAVMVEPMQCEGGDRFLSGRFFQGLLLLARSFDVPVIVDEVQTGFGLGGEFFWHRLFELEDETGEVIAPDFVTCAKKAQVGMVLSHQPVEYREQFSVASLARGFIQGTVLDQYRGKIDLLEKKTSSLLKKLVEKHGELIESPRGKGMAFSFDFKDPAILADFIKIRFKHGLLYYTAGTHTARFRSSLAWKEGTLEFFFKKLDAVLSELRGLEVPEVEDYSVTRINTSSQYGFHGELAGAQLRIYKGNQPQDQLASIEKTLEEIVSYYLGADASDVDVEFITTENYDKYRDKIIQIEEEVYEPLRRTEIEEFDIAIEAPNGVALAINFQGKMAGITFGAPLKRYPTHRGVRRDPFYDDIDSVYMLDVTVHPEFQGMGLGRILKYAFCLYSLEKGVNRIEGRNRDRLARGMYAINLALGARELMYLEEDYLDDEEFRDAIYYTIPLRWSRPKLSLSSAIDCPLSEEALSEEFIKKAMPGMINKISLGNFVNEQYLSNLERFSELLPEELRHSYVASGQSECVDKVFKSIWLSGNHKTKVLGFENMFFGEGSFLSRGLSGQGESMFSVELLPNPTTQDPDSVLSAVEDRLKEGEISSIYIEPMPQLSMVPVSESFLKELRRLCTEHQVALVFNDTGSLFNRYSSDSFLASASSVTPDAGFSFLGGQVGVCYMSEALYCTDPLKLISTWDGDEFSLASFIEELEVHSKNIKQRLENRDKFHAHLEQVFNDCQVEHKSLHKGYGRFQGNVPLSLARKFKTVDGYKLIAPTDCAISKFLNSLEAE